MCNTQQFTNTLSERLGPATLGNADREVKSHFQIGFMALTYLGSIIFHSDIILFFNLMNVGIVFPLDKAVQAQR